MSDSFHKGLAVLGTLAAIVLPIVAHSVYGANPHAAQAVAFGMTMLGVLGYAAVKPLFPGDVTKWVASHKALTLVGTALMTVLPLLSQTTFADRPAVKLALELASALLMALGFTKARPLGMSGAATLLPFLLLGGVTGCDWAPIDGMTGIALFVGGAAIALLVSRALALRSLLALALLSAFLALPGCAQYSACVKQQTTAAFKTLTAATVETQVIGLVNLGISEQFVQLGLQGFEDACEDTNCKALVGCVAIAWAEKHAITAAPLASAAKVKASQDGITAYLAKKPAAWLICGPRMVAVR